MRVELLTSEASLADMERFAAIAALTCHANTEKEHVPSKVLGNIIKLRTSPTALKEFQELARALYEAVPEGYRYLLADCVYQEGGNE